MNVALSCNFVGAKFNPEAFSVGNKINPNLSDTVSTSNIPQQIFSDLDNIQDIYNLQLVCKRFYNAANEKDVVLGKNQWERISGNFEFLNIHTKINYISSILEINKRAVGLETLQVEITQLQVEITQLKNSLGIHDILRLKDINVQIDKLHFGLSIIYLDTPKKLKDLFAFDLDKLFMDHKKEVAEQKEYYFSYRTFSSIPSEIKYYCNITSLSFFGNLLVHLPEELSCLTNLNKIDLSYNRFTDVPKILYSMSSTLKDLNLSNNYISSLPDEFGSLTNLERLDLSSNKLKTLPIDFGKLSLLNSLALESNKLESLPVEFFNLHSLTYLNLNINKLGCVPLEIGNLSKLQVLGLSHNNLKILPYQISNLSNLNLIDLSNNNLKIIPPEIFERSNLKIMSEENPLNLDTRLIIAEKTGDNWGLFIQILLNPQIIYETIPTIDYSFFGTKF